MQITDPITQKLTDFIYNYPEIAVVLLNKHGYAIDINSATLTQITNLVFNAVLVNQNIDLASDIDNAITNEGFTNILPVALIAGGASLVSSLIGSFSAKKTAKMQLETQRKIALANLAMEEKLKLEELKTTAETERTKILANTITEYRSLLQKEGTSRLKDTWLYVVAIGLSIGIITGVFLLIPSKKNG